MRWINCDLRFDDRLVMFTIGPATHDLLAQMRNVVCADVDKVEALLRFLVIEVRPDLNNCGILYIGYNALQRCLEIVVSHPSLDRVPAGMEMNRVRLFDADDFSEKVALAISKAFAELK